MKKLNLSDVQWQDRFSYQKSILFSEEDLDSKGSKVQVIRILPNGIIEPHYHKVRTEVFYVLKGTGVITLGNQDVESKEDDFMLCQPGTVHAFHNTGSEDFIVAVVRTNDPGDSDMLWVKDNTINLK